MKGKGQRHTVAKMVQGPDVSLSDECQELAAMSGGANHRKKKDTQAEDEWRNSSIR
jgi:hypothetical protein